MTNINPAKKGIETSPKGKTKILTEIGRRITAVSH